MELATNEFIVKMRNNSLRILKEMACEGLEETLSLDIILERLKEVSAERVKEMLMEELELNQELLNQLVCDSGAWKMVNERNEYLKLMIGKMLVVSSIENIF